jgi:hypothetical protein
MSTGGRHLDIHVVGPVLLHKRVVWQQWVACANELGGIGTENATRGCDAVELAGVSTWGRYLRFT